MRGRANLGSRLAWVRRHWPDPVTALTAMIVYRGFGPLSHPETWGGFFEEVVALRIGPASWERHPDSLALVALREKEGG